MVNGIAHCALYTPEAERAAQFYVDVFEGENLGWFQASTRGCWIRLGRDILEIFQSENLGTGCFKHIAIGCEDVDALYARALAYGAKPLEEPRNALLALKEPVQARLAFVEGLSGEQIELFRVKEV